MDNLRDSSQIQLIRLLSVAFPYSCRCSRNILYSLQSDTQNNTYITKAKIATEIAKTTGIDKASMVAVIEQSMTTVKEGLAHGENVYLRGFGSFIVKQRAAKTAGYISKNTTMIIPAHNIPAFKPAVIFKEEVASWASPSTRQQSLTSTTM